MQGGAEIRLKTDQETGEGSISGSGSVSFQVSDATRGTFKLDYETPDAITLSIRSTTALKIKNRDLTITLGGQILPKTREVAGSADLSLRISKEVAASIEHEINEQGGQTTLTVTVSF